MGDHTSVFPVVWEIEWTYLTYTLLISFPVALFGGGSLLWGGEKKKSKESEIGLWVYRTCMSMAYFLK